jgi:hypothetical protein
MTKVTFLCVPCYALDFFNQPRASLSPHAATYGAVLKELRTVLPAKAAPSLAGNDLSGEVPFHALCLCSLSCIRHSNFFSHQSSHIWTNSRFFMHKTTAPLQMRAHTHTRISWNAPSHSQLHTPASLATTLICAARETHLSSEPSLGLNLGMSKSLQKLGHLYVVANYARPEKREGY